MGAIDTSLPLPPASSVLHLDACRDLHHSAADSGISQQMQKEGNFIGQHPRPRESSLPLESKTELPGRVRLITLYQNGP